MCSIGNIKGLLAYKYHIISREIPIQYQEAALKLVKAFFHSHYVTGWKDTPSLKPSLNATN